MDGSSGFGAPQRKQRTDNTVDVLREQLPAPCQTESNTSAAGYFRSFMNQAILQGADGKASVITIPGFVQIHRRGCEFVSVGAEDYADSVRPVPAFIREVPP